MPFSIVSAPAVERILSELKAVKAAGEGKWMALCPAHDDKQRSLSIKVGTDGRALMNCHAGCATKSIAAAIGITMADLFPQGSQLARTTHPMERAEGVRQRAKLVATYDYRDADGNLLYQTCRFEPKTFRQRRKNPNGDWIYNLEGVTPVLYRLPEVIEAVATGKTIHIVEGEKDVQALSKIQYEATTSPMGAGKWRESYSEVLAGADVVIFPDNDDTGRSHAQQVAASLYARQCTVKVVSLPGLPPKGDISDWLRDGDLDELEAIIGKTERWTPESASGVRRVLYRLDELLQNDTIMRPPPPVVPRLAWAGRSTLLAAREKSGKSTLTGYIAAQVTNGGTFLGDPCASGDVLIVGLEEYVGDVARRLRHFGAAATRVHLQIGFLGDPDTRPQELRDTIDRINPVLVVLDSLAAYSHGIIQDDNNATQMAAVVQPLTNLAHDKGIALVIVHHARKSDGRARGSTAIMAGTDVVCEFFAPEEDTDPTLRRMRSAGRVPVQPVYDLRFDGNDYRLANGLEAPVEVRVLAVVAERPGCSINDVCEAVLARRDVVTKAIQVMLASRTIVNLSEGTHRARLAVPEQPHPGLSL